MKRITIIVVDDSLVSRLLPSFILRPYGTLVQVLECETGAKALRMMESHHVTHVLLDISMPSMDGIKVAQKIRADSRYATVQLIAYTADALVTDSSYLRSMGFDDVLFKPSRREDLLNVLGILPGT